MRIDLVITELFIGGAERQLTELAIGLSQRGATVRVISLDELAQTAPQDQLLRRLQEAGIEVCSLGCRSQWAVPQAIARLKRLFVADRPDLVQTFLFHANVIGTWAASRVGIPIRVGGVRVAQPNRARLWLERRAARQMEAIVCVSRSVEQFARQHLGSPQATMLTIPNGVDGQRFLTATPFVWEELGLDSDADVILYVGRLHPQKGTDWLMDAAPRLLLENPRAALVIVGSGPWRGMVAERLAKLPKGRSAMMPLQADIAPLMRAARLLLLPSRYEGMPNVVMEAMAAKLPVISTDAEGVRELLGEMADPQVVSFGDTDSLCGKLSALLNDPALRSQVVDSNDVRATDVFSVGAMVDRYWDLYQRLASAS
ncbi:N,N'-diacetylbacillosaminyl-diphospho-undecaprenol alpha-1,3-N-acetylgalactosaminyltransferase [Rosistilla ulvae]|uniref:N, N'-diacetylbacillosaminyl-diphospho-undecaprenol alpha-1,3-N-acetylgalactosaminyltransferase n=1 Tax=Rosistilla ulvae TaxID=1930277 RepID=A0A517LZ66_9BACT|nr:glycosyltransferase [Rosistilla ulvae]QDS87921.1 N,N'-diacetylbacillosaminyl-diphospho-undecaprenol alpha-1,3-N-acetylgalactosaminyltransferase [Rosistilla ulvae]